MVAWPGEKLDLYDAFVDGGSLDPYADLFFPLRVGESPDTTVTVSAGDSFYVYSRWPQLLLEDDPIGACTWVVDVDSGSASAAIETAYDPDWSYAPPFDWTAATVTALTAGRVLVPLPAGDRTYSRLVEAGAPLLRVTVTSGSAVLRAIYLQVEPPDGLKTLTGWAWSDWMEPDLVPAKGNVGYALGGASVSIGDSDDPNEAVDAIMSGGATWGASLHPLDAPPYSYIASGEVDADPFSGTFSAYAYDRSGAILTSPPSSFASFSVGYSMGYWRERPTLRVTPSAMSGLRVGRDFVRVDPGDATWAGYVEFAEGDTVAVEWADILVDVSAPEAVTNEVAGHIGFSPSILLPPTSGYGSLGGWPPPLGTEVLTMPGPGVPPDQVLLSMQPPPGSDWTVVSYTSMALGGYSPNDEWQQWTVTPTVYAILHRMPNYRYRVPVYTPDPDAVRTRPAPRFFVKTLAGRMAPVGFGKPPEETTEFHIQTAQGLYRDLTTAEYDSLLES